MSICKGNIIERLGECKNLRSRSGKEMSSERTG
jgi:hypothetical protein